MKRIILTLSLIVTLLTGMLFSNIAVKPTLAIGEYTLGPVYYVHIRYNCYEQYQNEYNLGVYVGRLDEGTVCF